MLSLFIPRVQTISKESQIQLGALDIPIFGSTTRNENAFHLTDTPHIKSSALLEHYLHVVRSYRGQKEVEDMMQSIELARRSSQPAKHMSATSELKRTASSAKPPPSTAVTCTSSTLESLIASTSRDISTEDIEGESSEEKGDKEDKSLVEDERTIDYLIVANPRDNRQKWLSLFYTYLNTPSCGRKKT